MKSRDCVNLCAQNNPMLICCRTVMNYITFPSWREELTPFVRMTTVFAHPFEGHGL